MDKKFSLQGGQLTEITPLVKKIAKRFESKELEVLFEISDFIRTNFSFREIIPNDSSEELFYKESHKRSADQILNSGYIWSCSDIGLLCVTLLRSIGIKCSYIQTVDVIALKNNSSDIKGHVYVGVLFDDKEFLFDPDKGILIKIDKPEDRKKLYKFRDIQKQIEVFENIDSAAANVNSQKELEELMLKTSLEYWKSK